MKKIMVWAVLVLLQQISSAAVWVEGGIIKSNSSGPLDLYIGYTPECRGDKSGSWLYPLDSLIESLPDDAEITQVKSSMYSCFYHLTSPTGDGVLKLPGEGFSTLYELCPDSSYGLIGTYGAFLDTYKVVHAPLEYQLGPGQGVEFIGYEFIHPLRSGLWQVGDDFWFESEDFAERCYDGWSIDGISVPYNVTFEYLTEIIGLDYGEHELKLYREWNVQVGDEYWPYEDYDITAITIVPEPVTFSLLTFGIVTVIHRQKY